MFPQFSFSNAHVKFYSKHVCVFIFVFNLFPAHKELGNVLFEQICLSVIKHLNAEHDLLHFNSSV